MFVEQFISGSDNIALLLHDENSDKSIAIDAPDGAAILKALKAKNRKLEALLITHHHFDHTAGISLLKQETGAKVYGPGAAVITEADSAMQGAESQIEGLDEELKDKQSFTVNNYKFEVITTPGHTLDEICFYMPDEKKVFTGDTLFSLGCGRVFEGNMDMMYNSLQKLKSLPEETEIYCGHEYSANNARFAQAVEPNNQALAQRSAEITNLRDKGEITLPSSLKQECATNPFLRCDSAEIRQNLQCADNAPDSQVFAKLRLKKDNF